MDKIQLRTSECTYVSQYGRFIFMVWGTFNVTLDRNLVHRRKFCVVIMSSSIVTVRSPGIVTQRNGLFTQKKFFSPHIPHYRSPNLRGRDNVIVVIRVEAGRSGVRTLTWARDFYLLRNAHNRSGAYQPSCWVRFFPGDKAVATWSWPPPSSAEVMNGWSYSSATLYTFTAWIRATWLVLNVQMSFESGQILENSYSQNV